ncbi:metalloendopeptidase-like membrane protein [Leptolyngbya sp. Heron Island J]|uniref:M23 family metallopeptidase n=1 Tax=Leptolyngbya sp. Heron Island J TaxID=1385935 RepID=UPI0003B9CD19|nr:peptidoglycan DD-metalloendopeptidase family protein [Leptolyngbya sp. Heron Island J]ESA32270.1 metalloendopeptidase-like membrane protein [Leptolyngbya sp. Heron Island J]
MNDVTPSATPTKRRCTVTVSARAWHGSKAAAQSVGCGSISELLEKLGNGELAVVLADEVGPPVDGQQDVVPTASATKGASASAQVVTAWPLDAADGYSGPAQSPVQSKAWLPQTVRSRFSLGKLPKLVLTATCASLIVLPILYVLDLRLSGSPKATVDLEGALTLKTGDTIAGYDVTDHMRIRPVHPVTGAANVPHDGVDLATPSGTPVYAVGVTGDQVTVECWWDVDGGGWVAEQTTESYPQLVFQSLHLLENECRSGKFTSGEVIALTGNSGLGSGEHYDFRVKLDGRYIDPPKQFVEAALTGKTLARDGKLSEF